ncbi:MAG: hypothetical protein Q7S68_01920 [Deltaproteobacteria bacterium]|nr:hypothetical protein [Deltaproteobacteria bacterium]
MGLLLAVAYFGMDFFFHHKCLGDQYAATAHLWRPMEEVKPLMWLAYVGYLLFGCVFYCIYGFGHESGKSGWKQGIRYGIMVGLLVWGIGNLIMVPFAPYPSKLVWSWFIIGMFEYAVLGLLTGLFYKPKEAM